MAKKKAPAAKGKKKAPAAKKKAAAKKKPAAATKKAAKKPPAKKPAKEPAAKKPAAKKPAAKKPVAKKPVAKKPAVAAPEEEGLLAVALPVPVPAEPVSATPPSPEPPPAALPTMSSADPAFTAADALAKNFHGHAVPAPISQLHRWTMGRLAERFAGTFEFVGDGADRARAWFQGNTDAADQLCVFGADGDGLYAFWTYAWRPIEEAPIVWLGPNQDGTVLASTPTDFLSLLALDVADLGREGWKRPAPLHSPGHAAYLAWLEATFGLSKPIDPAQVVERARRAHQDLGSWLQGVMGASRP